MKADRVDETTSLQYLDISAFIVKTTLRISSIAASHEEGSVSETSTILLFK